MSPLSLFSDLEQDWCPSVHLFSSGVLQCWKVDLIQAAQTGGHAHCAFLSVGHPTEMWSPPRQLKLCGFLHAGCQKKKSCCHFYAFVCRDNVPRFFCPQICYHRGIPASLIGLAVCQFSEPASYWFCQAQGKLLTASYRELLQWLMFFFLTKINLMQNQHRRASSEKTHRQEFQS